MAQYAPVEEIVEDVVAGERACEKEVCLDGVADVRQSCSSGPDVQVVIEVRALQDRVELRHDRVALVAALRKGLRHVGERLERRGAPREPGPFAGPGPAADDRN